MSETLRVTNDATASVSEPLNMDALIQEGDIAGDYLERLLDLLDYDGDIDLDVSDGRAIVNIAGGKSLDNLVGEDGQVLEALQDLTRLAVSQQTGARSRLLLDIANWRENRREELVGIAKVSIERVLQTGESARLRPMSAFERKVIHHVVNDSVGVVSESLGEEPNRRVVIIPDTAEQA